MSIQVNILYNLFFNQSSICSTVFKMEGTKFDWRGANFAGGVNEIKLGFQIL